MFAKVSAIVRKSDMQINPFPHMVKRQDINILLTSTCTFPSIDNMLAILSALDRHTKINKKDSLMASSRIYNCQLGVGQTLRIEHQKMHAA